jgi:tRNA threonylcarbamoyl adenosine modification protein (Sua5/YciO/YrdC/YwlC family)
LKTKKDTVGIRVPDNNICQEIIAALGNPIMTTSLPMEEDVAYYTDPEVIHATFGNRVDLVVDAGIGNIIPSTIIDCSENEAVLVREGLGVWGDSE